MLHVHLLLCHLVLCKKLFDYFVGTLEETNTRFYVRSLEDT